MKEEWKEAFSYSKSERKGIFVLSVILLLLFLNTVFHPFRSFQSYDYADFYLKLKAFQLSNDSANLAQNSTTKYAKKTERKPSIGTSGLNNFDPNIFTFEEWLSVGLTDRQANSILKYIEKGGRFYAPNDLRKMYCLTKAECDLLVPYVLIQESLDDAIGIPFEDEKTYYSVDSVELNSADVPNLIQISGIGAVTAKGIIKYRTMLGGFAKIEQLQEVYTIDSARYRRVKKYFIINLDSVKTLNINQLNYYELRKHPYISNNLAYEIAQRRTLKGDYKNLSELKKVKGMTDSIYVKVLPYLSLKNKIKPTE